STVLARKLWKQARQLSACRTSDMDAPCNQCASGDLAEQLEPPRAVLESGTGDPRVDQISNTDNGSGGHCCLIVLPRTIDEIAKSVSNQVANSGKVGVSEAMLADTR